MPIIEENFEYTHLAANATTVIKAQKGFLYAVVINTKGASSNTLTLYDNASAASGTVIAIIDTTSAVGPNLIYAVNFKNGLTVISATGTAADFTICYR